MEKLVVVGSGPAGLTAAIYAARALLDPLVLTGDTPGGQLTQTSDIENFPGFPAAINGYELMEAMRRQAERFGARIRVDTVLSAALRDGGPQVLDLLSGEQLSCRALIVATGASPRWLGIPAESRLMGKGVSACATCDGAFYRGLPVVVVGGGDTAMEEAVFLTRFASKVTIIHRRDAFRASKIMADRALSNPKIEVAWNSVVVDILGEDEVKAVLVEDVRTHERREIPCAGYFAALGHVPTTSAFSLAKDAHGYILLQDGSSQTSVRGVFAAGDCADPTYRQAVTAAGMGCKAALDAERFLQEA